LATLLLGVGAPAACGDDGGQTQVFCHADAMIGADGESFGRSGEHGCRFVDGDGKPITTELDGTPLCYGDEVTEAGRQAQEALLPAGTCG
jgi:hypothetical protein